MSKIPLTIFDLVDPRSLHKLYGMLGLALDEKVILQQKSLDAKGVHAPSHLSIILPTKEFRQTDIKYEMTVSNLYICPGCFLQSLINAYLRETLSCTDCIH
jgi:hypothetical protein